MELDYVCTKGDWFEAKALIDNVKEEKDLSIGFDPDQFRKNRVELKINLIYFDENITNYNYVYNYYKKFKVNVVGIFYASDEIEIFKQYLLTMQKENKVPPFLVVVTPKNFEEIYNISLYYNFIKEIILIDESNNQYYNNYLRTHNRLLRYIAKNYNDLVGYLKSIGDMTSNYNKFLRFFNRTRIFTFDEIQMNQQINMTPIITAYEYDELYYMIHRAYAHFFTNNSSYKNPRFENYPSIGENNFKKIYEFLNEFGQNENSNKMGVIIEFLKQKIEQLKKTRNMVEDAIKLYTEESCFCYIINKVTRNFDHNLIKLAYFIGPFLFGLNKYVLDHPEKSLRNNITLYRNMKISPLNKYLYTLDTGHIICFPALTSTSIKRDNFIPTKTALKINEIDEKDITIEMIIQYHHEDGNISPGLYIADLSDSKNEEEVLLLPFTFFKLNSVVETPNQPNKCILEMEIVNRKSYIEYELKEGKKYNLENLENILSKRPLFVEEGGIQYFEINHVNQFNEPNNEVNKGNWNWNLSCQII